MSAIDDHELTQEEIDYKFQFYRTDPQKFWEDGLVLENALEGVIRSLFGAFSRLDSGGSASWSL